ncbi:MAG TPA: rod shape-determining protein MreC [Vicinamibacterales bacterium]|jgi:rod shape-determining protein MreC|nr:rod shape-determining protein MreC [Vicinamibacterales bacterium]
MTATDVRQRTAVLFVAVMLGHILLISAQVQSRAGVPVLEVVTFGAFAEVQRALSAVTGGVRGAWTGYVNLRGVRAENEQLKRQLGELQIQFQQERAAGEHAHQLEALLGFQRQSNVQTIAANVIGAGASPDFRTMTIDKGSSSGLKANMPVISPTGVVGRIVTVTARASKVQLLVDRNAGAGALVERSRAQGVVLGAGEDVLRMDYVSGIADVKPGDTIVASGIDGIYPKGFVIGKVESVDRGTGIYKIIRVRPAVDFNRLEEVLVVTIPPETSAAGGPS